jgi:hypothetical protein
MRGWWIGCVVVVLATAACGDDQGETTEGTGGAGGATTSSTGGGATVEDLTVSGSVIGFDQAAISGSATIAVSGLNPPPTISVTGADFEISGVAPFSVFQILSGAPPEYRNTYEVATEVADEDVSGLEVRTVSETFLAELETTFGVTPAAGTGIVLGRAVGDDGSPRDGVEASVFEIGGAAPPAGPFFLDDANAPDAALTETSASGWVVFYDVPAGLVSFNAAMGSGVTVVAPESPVAANTVTITDLLVTDGELVIPVDVSFENDVVPIFAKRGCDVCHSGNSIGADLGDLALNSGLNKIYRELTEETSPTHGTVRVNLDVPAESILLTLPSFENPPDAHPNATFSSSADPDYLTILGWITEGAQQN